MRKTQRTEWSITVVVGLCLLVLPRLAPGQTDSTTRVRTSFIQRNFGKYLLADMYAPISSVQVGAGLNLREYNLNSKRKSLYVLYNETTLGVELPLYAVSKPRSKFALSLPISAAIWFDFTEQITAPILNTDYRFGIIEFNYLRRLHGRGLKNYAIKLIPLFHESTHLGDELVIERISSQFPITRVNVSYEVSELAFTLNDPDGRVESNHQLKVGARLLLNPSKGWYTIRSVEGDSSLVVPSRRSSEQYIQYQYQSVQGWLASPKTLFVFSLEARNRVLFGYPQFASRSLNRPETLSQIQSNEQMLLCFNGIAGWKFSSDARTLPRFGAYLRGYVGLNPHGQFRNIPYYQFLGISFMYEN